MAAGGILKMKKLEIWIFQTGEPLHCDAGNNRPMRAMNLSDKLLAGEISAALRQEISDILALIPETDTALRAAETIYLVVSSPEFAYQK